ncbi:hypothetical protein GGD68_004855 [Paraburkholderia fungorum]|uniref:Uncharacterized protein n=1 Tax=Paraburkholderia fungorum TaxID=134537 RepID=A0AAW3V2T8_9BURK|nr:hypothetical protein [Paraburkholderia fungorum]MBB6204839.1 hypothetical protein [Paraburkholderia fungorum]
MSPGIVAMAHDQRHVFTARLHGSLYQESQKMVNHLMILLLTKIGLG